MDQELVRKYFDYDPDTGELTWRVSPSSTAPVGARAGSLAHGYLRVMLNGIGYQVHRVIWLWVHGYFPEHQIDHINRIRNDNRLENLREVTKSCNMKNSKQFSNNKSGVTGVCWYSRGDKWLSQISVSSRQHNIGYSTDFTEAVLHRLAAEQCLNWEGCDSSSDAFKYLQELRNG